MRTLQAAVLILGVSIVGCGSEDPAVTPDGGGGQSGSSGSGGVGGTGGMGGSGNGTQFEFDAGVKFETPDGPCHAFGPTREALGSALEVLTPDLLPVSEIEATSAGVYFYAGGQIHRWSAQASAASVVVDDAVVSRRTGFVSNGTHVAWVGSANDQRGVWSIALAEDAPTPVRAIVDDENSWQLAIDDTHVYGWNFFNSMIMRAPLAGGTEEAVTSASSPSGMFVDGGFLYIAEEAGGVYTPDQVRRIPVTGGDSEMIATLSTGVHDFALDAERLYYTGDFGIRAQPRSDTSMTSSLLSFPSEVSQDARVVVSQFRSTEGLVLYVDLLNNVGWVRPDGSDCGLIVRELVPSTGLLSPVDVALDAEFIYLCDGESGLMRIPRSAYGL